MYRNRSIRQIKSLSAVLFLLFLFPALLNAQVDRAQLEKFQRALQVINLAYIEEVDNEELVENAIRGMLRELDPHSVYLSADELRRANEPLIGSFEGIGIQFNIINDSIVVISPVPGGPSEKVGILPGDKIVQIDGESSVGSHVNNQMVQDRLRGERGTRVEVSVSRRGSPRLLDFAITRDRIPINSLDASFMAAPEIGYIKINRFSRTTMREFRQALGDLKRQGMQHLILDLNYNSGGFLDVAIDLTDQFLERDQLIVYTEGHSAPEQRFNSTSRGEFKNGKLVVLVNEGSASASEILAGAIQDWDRGLVIGRRTFGKGLVQRPFELTDGSAIRLTTARYHTPTGRSIQKPYDEGADSYFADLSQRLRNGELVSPDNITFPDSLKYFTMHNKRVVYGGGGIMPDFFIPIDTTAVSGYYSRLMRRGILNTFGIEFTNENRQALLAAYPNPERFVEGFEVNQELLEALYIYSEDHGLPKMGQDEDPSDTHLRSQLKGLIARNLFDFGAYVQVTVQNDPAFKKALETLQNNTFELLSIRY
jgi:carboxyl-terminal processing protease